MAPGGVQRRARAGPGEVVGDAQHPVVGERDGVPELVVAEPDDPPVLVVHPVLDVPDGDVVVAERVQRQVVEVPGTGLSR